MNIKYEFDTITAIATPLGTGGVGVIRISGEKSYDIIKTIFAHKNISPDKIHFGWIIDGTTKIDEAIVLAFKAPRSFTGEDVIEIQCHGGLNVMKRILDLTIQNGARQAEKGEFTKRAFMNGKIDLSKAEAILDLIHAKTEKFAEKSAQTLSGTLSVALKKISNEIFTLLSQIIAAVDFPEDVNEPEYCILEEKIKSAIAEIDKILLSAKSSNIMREGIKVTIVGKPNAGKSSLFNALLNLKRAIVTDIAGTTRDILQETIDIAGIPVTLVDTAGIRQGMDVNKVEAIGIDYSLQSLNDADLILFVSDATTGKNNDDMQIFDLVKNKNYIEIASKADLLTENAEKRPEILYLSTKTNENLDLLKKKIEEKITQRDFSETEFVTNQRQQSCLKKSKEMLKSALTATVNHELQDLISIDIKSALLYLNEISGEVITDDILNNIFDNFCIGK